MRTAKFCSGLLCLVLAGCDSDRSGTHEAPAEPPVVVYATRDADIMQSVIDAFTADSGITVVLVAESGAALTDRLIAEKHRTTADLVLADGIGPLWSAAAEDLLRPSRSEQLPDNIPANLRDPEGIWFGLLAFGRTIAYDKRVVAAAELTGYADLAEERWRGTVCLSSAGDTDNQTLVAMMIAEHKDRPAELIVRSWIANLAMPIVADDGQILQAIEAGRCSLGIVNSDDARRLARDDPHTAVELFWPPASAGGAYINVVAAAVTRHAANPAGALQFLEWLSSERGQQLLAGQELEFTVNENLPIEHINPIGLTRAGFYHEDAVLLMERASWQK